jgi:hypothetical protein
MLNRPNRPTPTGGGPAEPTMPGGMPTSPPAGRPQFGTVGIGGSDASGGSGTSPALGGLNKPQDNRQRPSLAGIPQLDQSR